MQQQLNVTVLAIVQHVNAHLDTMAIHLSVAIESNAKLIMIVQITKHVWNKGVSTHAQA